MAKTLFLYIGIKKIIMKPFHLIFSLVLLGLAAASCSKINGEGDTVTEERTVTGFREISMSMDATVNYTQDTAYSLVLKGQQNILDKIETKVQNGRLTIRYEDHAVIGKHDPIVVEVSAPDVNSLDISGSGQINMFGLWEVYSANLNISGSGDINLAAVNVHDIDCTISGSGNIDVAWGIASYATLNISGSGNIDMLYVEADTAYATISGSGNIMVNVNKYLDATISGSGNIKYSGTPVVDTHISGSGSVIHL
jgi:hypothetical protein